MTFARQNIKIKGTKDVYIVIKKFMAGEEQKMRKKRIVRALVALMLAVALLSGSALAASRSAKVISSTMSVYKSKGGKRVGALRRGTSITVKGVSGSWAKISYRGKTCYARLKNIEFNKHVKAVTTQSSSIKFITRSSYKKRTYYTGTLAAGVTLYIAGEKDGNYLFYSEDGSARGYVPKSAVQKSN